MACRRERLDGARTTVADLTQLHRPSDVRESSMSQVQQVIDRHPAAQLVVDGHAAPGRVVARAVDDHQRRAALPRLVEHRGPRVHRRDEDAEDAPLLEPAQVGQLPLRSLVAVAEEERNASDLGRGLHPGRDIGEERVGRVEHDVADGVAPAGLQLPGRLVADEAEVQHRPLHPLAGGRADLLGPVEDVRDGAKRHPRGERDVLDPHRHRQVPSLKRFDPELAIPPAYSERHACQPRPSHRRGRRPAPARPRPGDQGARAASGRRRGERDVPPRRLPHARDRPASWACPTPRSTAEVVSRTRSTSRSSRSSDGSGPASASGSRCTR